MTPDRKVRCRYLLERTGDQCQQEIAGERDDDILLCPRHLYLAAEMFRYHQLGATLRAKVRT